MGMDGRMSGSAGASWLCGRTAGSAGRSGCCPDDTVAAGHDRDCPAGLYAAALFHTPTNAASSECNTGRHRHTPGQCYHFNNPLHHPHCHTHAAPLHAPRSRIAYASYGRAYPCASL